MTTPEPPGRLLGGRYRLLRPIGRGGMGVVWHGRDELLGRDVAVKEVWIPPGLPAGEQTVLRERTLREARAAARLSHPSIVTIYDVVEEDDRPWIVMALVRAPSLAEIIEREGPLPPDRTARIGLRLLEALRVAHAAGIAHRDVKPGNVLIDGDRVVLTDFGISTSEGDSTLTIAGTLLGAPGYIAPERAQGERGGPAADLWSLGATLYTAVEGHAPFQRDSAMATLTAVVTEDLPPAEHAGPLWPALEGLLRREPGERTGVADTAELLRRVAGAEPARHRPPPPVPGTEAVTDPLLRTVADRDAAAAPPGDTAVEDAAVQDAAAQDRAMADAERSGERPGGAGDRVRPPDEESSGAAPVAPAPAPAATPDAPPAPLKERPRPVPVPSRTGEPAPGRAAAVAGRRRNAVLAALAAAAVLLLAVVLWDPLTDRGGRTGSPAAGTSAAATAASSQPGERRSASPTGTASPSPTPTRSNSAPPTSPGGRLPAGLRWYRDPVGYQIGVPSGWQRTRTLVDYGERVTFTEAGGSGLLILEHTDDPRPDALEDWRANDRYRRANNPGYRQIRLERVEGYFTDAADLEFTYSGGGGTRHVLSRNVIVGDDHAYAIYWETSQAEFADRRPVLDAILASFQPIR